MFCLMKMRIPVLVICLVILMGLTGCATGSGSSSGSRSSRGSLSGAVNQSAGADKEEETGRGQGQSRTKTDHLSSGSSSYSDNDYYEDDSDDEGSFLDGFLVGLFTSLFSGGGDDEPAEDPPSYGTNYSETGNRTWGDTEEFGLDDDDPASKVDTNDGPDIEGSNVNFWYSRSRLGGDTVERFNHYTLMYSWYTGPRYRAHVGLYYGRGKIGNQGNLKEGLRWINEAGIDVGTRGYLTPRHSLLGFYLIAGLRVGSMYWSYSQALESLDDEGNPETISHDGLFLFVPYMGVGTSLLQTKSVHLGVNFTLGGRLTVDKTFKNYDNDLFKHVGEYKLNIEASIFF